MIKRRSPGSSATPPVTPERLNDVPKCDVPERDVPDKRNALPPGDEVRERIGQELRSQKRGEMGQAHEGRKIEHIAGIEPLR